MIKSIRSLLAAAAFIACLLAGVSAQAAVLYDNGPANGTLISWIIGNCIGCATANSFTLASPSIVTGINFASWNSPGSTVTTIDWGITSVPNTYPDQGTANVTSTFLFAKNSQFDVYSNTFSINVSLAAGTHYLVLLNGTGGNGTAIGWDENLGPSTAYVNGLGLVTGQCEGPFFADCGSETFQILGTVSETATPLPATFPLFATGLGTLAVLTRRRKQQNAAAKT